MVLWHSLIPWSGLSHYSAKMNFLWDRVSLFLSSSNLLALLPLFHLDEFLLKVETAYPSKHLDDAVAVSEFHLRIIIVIAHASFSMKKRWKNILFWEYCKLPFDDVIFFTLEKQKQYAFYISHCYKSWKIFFIKKIIFREEEEGTHID